MPRPLPTPFDDDVGSDCSHDGRDFLGATEGVDSDWEEDAVITGAALAPKGVDCELSISLSYWGDGNKNCRKSRCACMRK